MARHFFIIKLPLSQDLVFTVDGSFPLRKFPPSRRCSHILTIFGNSASIFEFALILFTLLRKFWQLNFFLWKFCDFLKSFSYAQDFTHLVSLLGLYFQIRYLTFCSLGYVPSTFCKIQNAHWLLVISSYPLIWPFCREKFSSKMYVYFFLYMQYFSDLLFWSAFFRCTVFVPFFHLVLPIWLVHGFHQFEILQRVVCNKLHWIYRKFNSHCGAPIRFFLIAFFYR